MNPDLQNALAHLEAALQDVSAHYDHDLLDACYPFKTSLDELLPLVWRWTNQAHLLAMSGLLGETRSALIDWLCRNDPNGVYADADAIAEGMEPLTLEQARQLVISQLEG